MHSLGAYFLSRDIGDGKRCWNQHSSALIRFLTYSFRASFAKNHLNFFKRILGCARALSEIFMWHNQSRKRPLKRAHEVIHPRTRLNNVELSFFTKVSRSSALSETFEDPKSKSKLRKWNGVNKSYLLWVNPWIMFEWPTWEFRLWNNSVSNVAAFHVPNLMPKLLLFILTGKHCADHCRSENELSPTN